MSNHKDIAVVCGAGVVTSSLIARLVQEHYAPTAIQIRVFEATVMDLLSPQFSADAIVTTVNIPESIGIPVVSGMPLLLRTDPAATFSILDKLLGVQA